MQAFIKGFILLLFILGNSAFAQEEQIIPNRNETHSVRVEEYRAYMDQLQRSMVDANDSLMVDSYSKLSRFYSLSYNVEKANYYKDLEIKLLEENFSVDTTRLYLAILEKISIGDNFKSKIENKDVIFEILDYASREVNSDSIHTELIRMSTAIYLSSLIRDNRFDEYSEFYTQLYPALLNKLKKNNKHSYYRAMGTIKESKQESDSSIYFMNKAGIEFKLSKNHNIYYKSNFFYRYGQLLERQNHEEEAIKQYVYALTIAEEVGYVPFMLQSSRRLLELSIRNKEVENALKYANLNYELQKDISDLASSEALLKIEMEKENELAEIELEKIALENKAKMEVVRNRKNIFLITGIALLILIIGLWNRYRFIFRAKKKLEGEKEKTEKAILKAEALKVQAEKEKKRAEESEAFERQFLANMSHEIRTPMNAVMGMTSLVLDTKLNDKQRDYVKGIQLSSENLLHIINDILDLSKIEAGKMELENIDFSISDTIDQVKRTLLHRAADKGLELKSSISSDVKNVVLGDPFRLSQVLINLIGNAIKFTENGSVSITVINVEDKVKISISDTGIGISKGKLKEVFKNFTQAHVSDNRKYGGTGLGLSISKQLVEKMGGNITIESEEGIGTTFSVHLNFVPGDENLLRERTNLKNDVDGSILDGINVLVVDDNEFNRIVAGDILQSKANLTIVEAVNGQEAFDLMKATNFDVVLMDVQMPVLNGYLATKKIRKELPEPKCNTPIIALTASVLKGDIDRCKEAGMDSYIAKPFKPEHLITEIAKALNIELRT